MTRSTEKATAASHAGDGARRARRLVIALGTAAGLALFPPQAEAQRSDAEPARATRSATVSFGPAESGFAITIEAPGALRATIREEGQDLLISFPGPLPRLDAAALQEEAAGWVEAVNTGYDALLLQLAPGVVASRAGDGRRLRILLTRQPAADTGLASEVTPEMAEQGEFRLRLLEAQLLVLTGRLGEARQQYQALRAAMPERAEPVSGLASVEHQAGRWRRSMALYREAVLLDPADPSLAATLAAIERERAPRLRAEFEYRHLEHGVSTAEADTVIGEVGGFQAFGEGWRLGVTFGLAHVSASQLQRANGAVGPFSGERQHFELFVQYDAPGGATVIGSVFGTEETAGVGLRAQLPDDSGFTTLRADYHRPNWDFVESIVEHGTRDRLAVGRFQRLLPGLTARLEAGFNRYGIPDDEDLVRTWSVTGELRLSDIGGIKGLTVAYGLDSEYVSHRSVRHDSAGNVFLPLPVLDREVHLATVGYVGSLGSGMEAGRLVYQAYGGYGADRYGRSGPLVSAIIGYSIGSFEFQLRASYVNNISRTRGTGTTVGGVLTWVF